MKKMIYAMILISVMSFACLTGCGQYTIVKKDNLENLQNAQIQQSLQDAGSLQGAENPQSLQNTESPQSLQNTESPQSPQQGIALASGGVLYLSVNPEIAISYDADGNVTQVEARNADAKKILEGYVDYQGKAARQVVSELVTAIGQAGYFVEEVEGERRRIVIEIEPGSSLPNDTFLDEVVADVEKCINNSDWQKPVTPSETGGKSQTIYVDTDYGPYGDGFTDYHDTDYGPNSDGVTDYHDTDYGPNSDGVTDYHNTDYGPNSDGVTDYHNTDYGPNSDGVTDYHNTDYHRTDYHVTDYGNDGLTDYHRTDYYD